MKKAISMYKFVKRNCDIPCLFEYKIKAYKYLGLCCIMIKKYKESLHYFGKMLGLSYYINNVDIELKAYDLIGLSFYYLVKN